jgi:predicted acylesterase/phospholipase RssA
MFKNAPRPATESGELPVGVVLSGGGASGAYEVGVLKALLTTGKRPLDPLVFAGTSIGSFNASFLVSQWDSQGRSAIANLEALWRGRLATFLGGLGRANGLFRVRASPIDFLDPQAYLPNPMRPFVRLAGDGIHFLFEAMRRVSYLGLSRENFLQRAANLLDVSSLLGTESWEDLTRSLDFHAIRHSTRRLRIAATNWQTGELRVFANRDMTDETGSLAIEASSAIPGLLPLVRIGAEPHVDGGVVMNTPLELGIKAGADELHVVYLDPAVRAIPTAALNSTLDSAYRQQVISWATVINEDIATARWVNRTLLALQRLRENPRANAVDISWLEQELEVKGLRRLTVHRYHPRDDLAGGALGLLNFDRGHIAHLIDRGFNDATHHDCDESGCVLLGSGALLPDAAAPHLVEPGSGI